jgi:hypothetical protein
MGQIVTSAPPRPTSLVPDLEPELEAICLKMMARRPEDRFATMHDVVAALEAYAAGRPTGVPAGARRPVSIEPVRAGAGDATRGIVIAPWMLATFVAIVVAGFGVTWHLVRVALEQRSGPDEIKLSREDRQDGSATVLLNNRELTPAQLEEPLELPAGDNTITVRDRGGAVTTHTYRSDKSDPLVLSTNDEALLVESAQRRVARSIIAAGGRVNFGNGFVSQIDELPRGQAQIVEIDLSGARSVSAARLRAIERLGQPPRRLILPKSEISRQRLEDLRSELPDTTVEVAEPDPSPH